MTSLNTSTPQGVASVNGVTLHPPGEALSPESLRQRASTELLRQGAIRANLLSNETSPPWTAGAISETASQAIERLIEQLTPTQPDDGACRRHHAAHPTAWGPGPRLHVRHILFALTPGVDPQALQQRAEAALIHLRCEPADSSSFAQQAQALSNCPSGAQGGDLGWLQATDCAPEFAQEVFEGVHMGVLPRLVRSRWGFHVVEILARETPEQPAFESVAEAVRQRLHQHQTLDALRRWLDAQAAQSVLVGVPWLAHTN